MARSKLAPDDPRVQRKEATVRGKTYSYLHAKSANTDKPKGHVLRPRFP
jgi:hypothetical protein